MRVLVTGGAGYVGSFTIRALLGAGHDVVAIDDLSRGHRAALPPGVELVLGSVESEALAQVLRERRFDAVVHFAAFLDVGESVRDPKRYYRNNVAATLTLLETMLAHDLRRIVFSSSCAVYGEARGAPIPEDAARQPVSPYAFTKLAIERMIEDFASAYGVGHVLLRYFNAAGGSADGEHGEDHRPETHLIPLVLQTASRRREVLDVYGDDYPTADGTCVRDYVHVEDLARAHELALRACPAPADARPGRVYNVGTGTGHSVREVIRCAERVTGKTVPYRVTGRRAGDPPVLVARCDRLRTDLGWKPLYGSLDEIVATAWAWHRRHPDGYED